MQGYQQGGHPPPPPQYSPPFAVNSPYGQQVMGNVYASPPQHGSLGTPHIGRWTKSPSGSHDNRGSWRGSAPGGSYNNSNNRGPQSGPREAVTLVPTRPLLKALARECKPSPPWCVGLPPPQSVSDELMMFASFFRQTPEEQMRSGSFIATVETIFLEAWGDSVLNEMGATAAGVIMSKDVTAHFYALGTTDEPAKLEVLKQSASNYGFQVEFKVDYRGMPCATLTEARTGEKCVVRYGETAKECQEAANILKEQIASKPHRKAVLVAIDSLLRQNKVLDDTGTNVSLLNGEAVAFMVLSIANSYSDDDTPDAGRLLVDFFLTFGFQAHFDFATNSIHYKGMDPPVSKVHMDDQLSVLDPSNPERNLTPKLEKFSHIQAVFHYCYTAISQFTQVSAQQRRAQSALSTVIGGESFWSRVLSMYHQQVSPFLEVVRDRAHVLAQAL
jgi:hypothetical protein